MAGCIIDRDQPQAAELESRLFNWKFGSAQDHLDGQPPRVRALIEGLAGYRNEGWDDDTESELRPEERQLIRAVVTHLIGYNEG